MEVGIGEELGASDVEGSVEPNGCEDILQRTLLGASVVHQVRRHPWDPQIVGKLCELASQPIILRKRVGTQFQEELTAEDLTELPQEVARAETPLTEPFRASGDVRSIRFSLSQSRTKLEAITEARTHRLPPSSLGPPILPATPCIQSQEDAVHRPKAAATKEYEALCTLGQPFERE